jgi:uncharacterized protein
MNSSSFIGLGLRYPHYQQVLEEQPAIGWFEVHSENFFRTQYPISLHGVGLSLGSDQDPSMEHLQRLKNLILHMDPFLISEHLSWSTLRGTYIPDLLPIPYNAESLGIFSKNIEKTQDFLGRLLLIENPSSYLEYTGSDWTESEFLVELCRRTGAKILLDINNLFVSASNHGWDPKQYINSIPIDLVKELHIAGHSCKSLSENKIIRIDTHDQKVCPQVWELYGYATQRFGCIRSLLEWDAELPPLSDLQQEAQKMQEYMHVCA